MFDFTSWTVEYVTMTEVGPVTRMVEFETYVEAVDFAEERKRYTADGIVVRCDGVEVTDW